MFGVETNLNTVLGEEHRNDVTQSVVIRYLLELYSTPNPIACITSLTKRSTVVGLALVQTSVVGVERYRVWIPSRMSVERVFPRNEPHS